MAAQVNIALIDEGDEMERVAHSVDAPPTAANLPVLAFVASQLLLTGVEGAEQFLQSEAIAASLFWRGLHAKINARASRMVPTARSRRLGLLFHFGGRGRTRLTVTVVGLLASSRSSRWLNDPGR
jgi:hypothetical protein